MTLPKMDILFAQIPISIGASEAVHRQRLLDEEAEAEERQEEFYLDVFCDANSRKKDEVHDAIVVLKDGKVRTYRTLTTRVLLTIARSDYGRKTQRLSYPRKDPMAKKRPTRSQASTFPSHPRTSRTARYRTHLSSASLVPCPSQTPPSQTSPSSIGYTPIALHAKFATGRARRQRNTLWGVGIGQKMNKG